MICIQYKDTIELVLTEPDEYGTEQLVVSANVNAAVELNTGYQYGNNQDAVISDAIVFVNPKDQFVIDNYYRLEEMLVCIQLFNTPESEAWYKIVNVIVARDHQLCNRIDNVELQLKKTVRLT